MRFVTCHFSTLQQFFLNLYVLMFATFKVFAFATGIGDLDDFGSISIPSPLAAPKSNITKKSVAEKPRVVVV